MIPKVAICVPYYRTVEGPAAMAFMALGFGSAASVAAVPISTSGCYIEDNRNGCIQYAMNMEEKGGFQFDWVFWIDSDMVFPPDALVRLIRRDKDIVGANYRQRTPPHAAVGVYEDGMMSHDLLRPGLFPMKQMPTGLLLTRFDIYRKMGYPWFKPGLNNEPRDDIFFCRMAKAMGYEIWCDHDLTFETIHYDGYAIPWFRPDQIVIKHEGVIIDNEKAAAAGVERARLSGESFVAELANGGAA